MNPDEAYIVLEAVEELLRDQSDVIDGPEGTQKPNKAMSLLPRVEEVLRWLETL